ncbi:hypothetical protein GCM10027088_17760 [Nocardia goodfellowii]
MPVPGGRQVVLGTIIRTRLHSRKAVAGPDPGYADPVTDPIAAGSATALGAMQAGVAMSRNAIVPVRAR